MILRFKGLMQLFTFLWWPFASLFSFCCHLFSEILESVDFGFIGEKSSLYCNPFKNMCALRISIIKIGLVHAILGHSWIHVCPF